ncbi:MAG TPA: hypothetical protein VHN58_11545, partial [Croceicoccus sp.]|nr:hypothetical protein [Croceicoccus sp.]
ISGANMTPMACANFMHMGVVKDCILKRIWNIWTWQGDGPPYQIQKPCVSDFSADFVSAKDARWDPRPSPGIAIIAVCGAKMIGALRERLAN